MEFYATVLLGHKGNRIMDILGNLNRVHEQHHVLDTRPAHARQIRRAAEAGPLAGQGHGFQRVQEVALRARDRPVVAVGVPRRVAVEAAVPERVLLLRGEHHARLPARNVREAAAMARAAGG